MAVRARGASAFLGREMIAGAAGVKLIAAQPDGQLALRLQYLERFFAGDGDGEDGVVALDAPVQLGVRPVAVDGGEQFAGELLDGLVMGQMGVMPDLVFEGAVAFLHQIVFPAEGIAGGVGGEDGLEVGHKAGG